MSKPAIIRSQEYSANNLLDRHASPGRFQHFYDHFAAREVWLLRRYCSDYFESNAHASRILSVGCGPDPRRGLPPGEYYLVGVDSDPEMVARARESEMANEVHVGIASTLPFEAEQFDVVIFRAMLHHVIYQGPLHPTIQEAYRVLKRGGVIVAVEPNLFHPVGVLLAISNQLGLSKWIHGTVDDFPLSPFRLRRIMERVGFRSCVYGVTYSWRRLPIRIQKFIETISSFGTLPMLKYMAHTFMVIGHK